ncbi:hypothetical protein G5I_01479 [Acromyrmex echinatior]|uniref:Uncharacterized protein n=1 Tax=Acromyrmex echinatior TaxID=103372 RepID=F4W7Q8_ACREC|nr:hypothetical protein G5I_01479 [Acromyrmex echinatior]
MGRLFVGLTAKLASLSERQIALKRRCARLEEAMDSGHRNFAVSDAAPSHRLFTRFKHLMNEQLDHKLIIFDLPKISSEERMEMLQIATSLCNIAVRIRNIAVLRIAQSLGRYRSPRLGAQINVTYNLGELSHETYEPLDIQKRADQQMQWILHIVLPQIGESSHHYAVNDAMIRGPADRHYVGWNHIPLIVAATSAPSQMHLLLPAVTDTITGFIFVPPI